MATRHKLTIETLTELGARKLAELLLAEAAGNRQLKQTLNLAISAKEGHPPPQKLPIAPIFIADSISLAVSREKDGKLRIVYAGWDNANVVQPDGYGQARGWTGGSYPPPWGEALTPLKN
jgi:hypothetical protein